MAKIPPTVLIAPLNWGLGHATRCIPLIRELLIHSCKVIICGNGKSLQLLKLEFPELHFEELPEFTIKYSKNSLFFNLTMLGQFPNLLRSIEADTEAANRLAKKYQADIIISDNRYGFYESSVFSIFLTHQIQPIINLNIGFISHLIYNKIFSMMNRFDSVWVPDYPDYPNLSGKLSHLTKYKKSVTYCGPLSRFSDTFSKNTIYESDVMVIISGPEPQRTQFEQSVLKELQNTTYKIIMFAGKPHSESKQEISENITIFTHANSHIFEKYLSNTKLLISRSGYSTIMDAYLMQKRAILIPTPGQTEQEYLAELHKNSELFFPISHFDELRQIIDNILLSVENEKKHISVLYKQLIAKLVDEVEKK